MEKNYIIALGLPILLLSLFFNFKKSNIEKNPLGVKKSCQLNAIETSRCIYEAMLLDVSKTYDSTGGGGISSIKQNTTTNFTVSISQEGRTDLITYELSLEPTIKILKKTLGVKSPGPE